MRAIQQVLSAQGAAGGGLDAETITWRDGAIAAGGTFAGDSIALADALIVALKAASYNAGVKWLLPLLGSNLAAARMPLRDSLGKGIATNANFVDGDFSQATGLKGNGSNKILDTKIKPSDLGTSNACGIGYWENDIDFTGSGSEPIGMNTNPFNGNRYSFDLRSGSKWISLGDVANRYTAATAAGNGHYYGQRSSATSRKLFFAGALLGTNTTSDAAVGAADRNMRLMGVDATGSLIYWKGRCACAYATDGTLSDADAAAFHTLLGTYLITPTGR